MRRAHRKRLPLPIRTVSDRLEPRLRNAFLRAVTTVRDGIAVDALAEAVRTSDAPTIARLADQFPAALGESTGVLRQAFLATGTVAAHTLSEQIGPRKTGQSVTFDATNPRAVSWITRNGGRFVVDVTDEAREAIRTLLRDAFVSGITPAETARRIRAAIGLTDQLANAVVAYRHRLSDEGRDVAAIARLGDRYSQQLLNYRARVIARTEIIEASANGQQELWRQARDRGLLSHEAQRIWIVTEDDRTCTDICVPMDNQRAGLEEPFLTGEGQPVMTPPAHQQCRCALGIQP